MVSEDEGKISNPVLDVRNLKTQFFTRAGVVHSVDDVSFQVGQGETLGIVGESGCGKSVTSLSIMRLIPEPPGKIVGGQVLLNTGKETKDLVKLSDAAMRRVRGNEIAVSGPPGDVALASRLLDELVEVVEAGTQLTADVVSRSIAMLTAATASRPAEVLTLNILSSRGRTIRPKTVGQKRYVEAIDASTITFGIGPAGTGKTYLAMAMAVSTVMPETNGNCPPVRTSP